MKDSTSADFQTIFKNNLAIVSNTILLVKLNGMSRSHYLENLKTAAASYMASISVYDSMVDTYNSAIDSESLPGYLESLNQMYQDIKTNESLFAAAKTEMTVAIGELAMPTKV